MKILSLALAFALSLSLALIGHLNISRQKLQEELESIRSKNNSARQISYDAELMKRTKLEAIIVKQDQCIVSQDRAIHRLLLINKRLIANLNATEAILDNVIRADSELFSAVGKLLDDNPQLEGKLPVVSIPAETLVSPGILHGPGIIPKAKGVTK